MRTFWAGQGGSPSVQNGSLGPGVSVLGPWAQGRSSPGAQGADWLFHTRDPRCPPLPQEMIPFAVVGSDHEYQVNGKRILGRKTKWGTIEGNHGAGVWGCWADQQNTATAVDLEPTPRPEWGILETSLRALPHPCAVLTAVS